MENKVLGNDLTTIEKWLDEGLDINAKDENNNTLLEQALHSKLFDISCMLLRRGAAIQNQKAVMNNLIYASKAGNHDAVLEFSKHTDVNFKAGNSLRTALMFAIEHVHDKVIENLLTAPNIDINATDEKNHTALMIAAEHGHDKVVEKLLTVPNIDINIKNHNGNTALVLSVQNCHYNIASMLLDMPNVDLKNIMIALVEKNDSYPLAEKVIEMPAVNVNECRCDEKSALAIAIENGNEKIVEKLLSAPDIITDEAFIEAISHGHFNIVKKILDNSNTALNTPYSYKYPLTAAISSNRAEIVKLLINTPGIKPNVQSISGRTPLILAVENGCIEIVDQLLSLPDTDINIKNNIGDTALNIAARCGENKIFERLIALPSIDINSKNKFNEYTLINAVKYIDSPLVHKMLDNTSINVNVCDEYGNNPLVYAYAYGKNDIVERLHSLNVTISNDQAGAALLKAIKKGNDNAIPALLAIPNINVNVRNIGTKTALMLAVEKNNEPLVVQLLSVPGIDVNAQDKHEKTALFIAVQNENENIVKHLVALQETDTNITIDNVYYGNKMHDNSPLILATYKKNVNIVRLLLSNSNTDINIQNPQGITPLIIAIQSGNIEISSQLLAMPNIKCNLDNLLVAIEKNMDEIIDILINEKGIDINLQNSYGETALMQAIENKNISLAKKLMSTENINISSKKGFTAFMLAAIYGPYEIVDYILENYKININAKNNSGNTALIFATLNKRNDIVERLLKIDSIEVGTQNEQGETALMFAAKNINHSLVEKMLSMPGINASARDNNLYNAFLHAKAAGRDHTASILKPFSENMTINDAEKLLLNATKMKHNLIIPTLMSITNININAVDKHNNTALLIATSEENITILKQLLTHPNIDVNHEDNNKNTALILATNRKNITILKQLLKHPNIDINHKDKHNNTALIIAASQKSDKIVAELLKHPKIDLKHKGEKKNMAITYPIRSGNIAVLRLFLNKLNIKAITLKNAGSNLFLLSNEKILHYIMYSGIIGSGDQKISESIEKIKWFEEKNARHYKGQEQHTFLTKKKELLCSIDDLSKSAAIETKMTKMKLMIAGLCTPCIPESTITQYTGMNIFKFKAIIEIIRLSKIEGLMSKFNYYIFIHTLMLRANLNTIFANMPFDIKTNLLEFIVDSDIKQVVTSIEAFHKSLLTPQANTNNGPAEEIEVETPTNS